MSTDNDERDALIRAVESTPSTEESRDPVGHLPQDGLWYPAEVAPGQWQGHRKWAERAGGAAHPCHYAENDVEDEQAVTFGTEAECQGRCDALNAQLV
jgi:hypothetical protein